MSRPNRVKAATCPHRLHALDITTGNERFSGLMTIAVSVNVPAGTVTSMARHHLNRPGLLWLNGIMPISRTPRTVTYTPYHGWLLAYDASTLFAKGRFP